ncbi:hypothetical protein ACLB2K_012872 [Fragaria x ananassa]
MDPKCTIEPEASLVRRQKRIRIGQRPAAHLQLLLHLPIFFLGGKEEFYLKQRYYSSYGMYNTSFLTIPLRWILVLNTQMACSFSLPSTGLQTFGLNPESKVSQAKYGVFTLRSSPGSLRVRAVQETGGSRRLVDIIRTVPELSRNYFRSPSRRALFGGISLLGGFYVAQTISLSFGALGVNDVIAAVVCVLLTEYVTKFYYSRPKVTFPIALLNNFKMGFTYGLFIDAFKLAISYGMLFFFLNKLQLILHNHISWRNKDKTATYFGRSYPNTVSSLMIAFRTSAV